jgi:uncharacterized protein
MTNIIDRRLNPRDKTIKNRQKFIERSKAYIKEAVKESINSGNIADIENGKLKVRVKGISEPNFNIDSKSGNKKYILPGNKKYTVGDQEEKPESESGNGSGNKGSLGQGEDDFEFVLNQEELLNFIFDDLELPDLIKKQMKDVTKLELKRSGYTNQGNPSQLDIVRSLKNGIGRRIGLLRPKDEDIEQLEKELLETTDPDRILLLEEKIQQLKNKQKAIPWLDPFDIRYRNFNQVPTFMTKAVMFCIMDVSGSMGQREKELAKRFFFFLYMFLRRKYNKVEIVFVRHHEDAKEVDEHTFFFERESGGTVVSSALKLTKEIIDQRYNINDYNIYISQVSDGDNFPSDHLNTIEAMNNLLPIVQYFAYLEVKNLQYQIVFGNTDLWDSYLTLVEQYPVLKLKKAYEVQEIWKIFQELFSKERS